MALATVLLLLAGGRPHAADPPAQDVTKLTVTIRGDAFALETLILTPPGAGPFPLALLTHGSPRDATARGRITARSYTPQAMEFARRGYLTAVVVRRGYGTSEGRWFEDYGSCDFAEYERAGKTTADDLVAALEVLKRRPDVDGGRILVVGVSAGGFGALAVAARNPAGVAAAINFAGGRGSRSPDEVCAEGRLVDAFEALGRTARVPSLWVYAENDGYFAPALARSFHRAYTTAGGVADLVQTGPFGRDGHSLFSAGGIPIWRPLVDDFLRKVGLPTWDAPPPPLAVPDVPPPSGLSDNGRANWQRYLAAPDHKAFAKSRAGARFGWRSGRNSVEDARDGALGNCKTEDCEVVSTDGQAAR